MSDSSVWPELKLQGLPCKAVERLGLGHPIQILGAGRVTVEVVLRALVVLANKVR